jgi:hypothetical protein
MNEDTEAAPDSAVSAREEPAGAAPPAEGDEQVEYQYVYEDEHGNPMAAPAGEVNPEHYHEEVVGVQDGDAAPAAAPTDETVTIRPEDQPGSKRTTATRPTRRRPRSQSGRSTARQPGPAEMKYARLKTVLMIGSLALIPVLTVAIVMTWCYKHGKWPFRRRVVEKVVKSDVDQALDLHSRASRAYNLAREAAQEGKDVQAYDLFCVAEKDFEQARKMLQEWREKNPDPGYFRLDGYIADINIKLREARDSKFRFEMRKNQ